MFSLNIYFWKDGCVLHTINTVIYWTYYLYFFHDSVFKYDCGVVKFELNLLNGQYM